MGGLGQTRKIVVGYDGSEAARRCLARARQIAAGRLGLVVVAVAPELHSTGLDVELAARAIEPERLLEEARGLLADGDEMAVETRAAVGDPAAVLVDTAREVGAELVVVGRRGRDFVARTLLGSVAQRVVQAAACDVLVVR
jgi:nucleotide-binding universal stress UspA family protein